MYRVRVSVCVCLGGGEGGGGGVGGEGIGINRAISIHDFLLCVVSFLVLVTPCRVIELPASITFPTPRPIAHM